MSPAAVSPSRLVAHRVIRRVTADDAWADRVFRTEAERANLPARDRAFAQQLAYGTVQRMRTLDHVLVNASDRPLEKVHPSLRDALRLGIYQLLYMDSVPDHAAVEQTVELAKAVKPRAHGFVNAIMRRIAREGQDVVDRIDTSTAKGAALAHSHPDWIAELWWDQLGPAEALALLERDNEPPESALRANTLATTTDELADAIGVPSRRIHDVPEGLVLEAAWDAHGSQAFKDGLVTPQSRGSMLVAHVLDPQPGDAVLDMCAAPGAKTTHIAALMKGEGTLVAVERDRTRANQLRENVERMRAPWVNVITGDARESPKGPFDRILIDAPCSDLGTLQSRPDARWRKSADLVGELATLQRELLEAGLSRLAPKGTIVYSTCTISPAENERQIAAFAADHPELELVDLSSDHPSVAHPVVPGYLQLLPHRDGADGFFIARLRRRD